MSPPTHPLLTLLECHATGLKSMLTHYIDATVDSQFASLKNSLEKMVQSGMIGPNCGVTTFGTTLPPPTQTNTHQSSAQCSHEYSNDTLTRTQEHQNNLQNEVSLGNKINTQSMLKQEFDDEDEDDGEEINDDDVAKCDKCEKSICTSSGTTHLNVHAALENNQIISNDISPSQSPTNPINTEPQIKQQCLQASSITSIPLDLNKNAALNDLSIDEPIERQSTQIQTDEFDDNDEVVDDYCEDGADNEYLNEPNFANETCDLDHESNINHLNNDASARDGDETYTETNFENTDNTSWDHSENEIEPQPDNYAPLENNQINRSIISNGQEVINANDDATENIELQVNDQSDDHLQNVRSVNSNDRSVVESSNSGHLQSSTRKRIQTKAFGDAQLEHVTLLKSGKWKGVQSNNQNVKKVDRQNDIENDIEDERDCDEFFDGKSEVDEDEDERDPEYEESSRPFKRSRMDLTQPNNAQSTRHYQCPQCPKSFNKNYILQQHLRVHTGERPFECDLCGKRFSQPGGLTKHKLIHQNIKNFRCHECDKQFTQKIQLDSHLRTHSGERPFKCRHCENLFSRSDDRNRHEQAIHLHVKPYRCKQCGYTVTVRTNIIRHIRMVYFGLPRTVKEQQTLNIIDDRDQRELVEKV